MNKISTLLLLVLTINAKATGFNDLWFVSSEKTVQVAGERTIIPSEYLLVKLNLNGFHLAQSLIPSTQNGNSSIIYLPNPLGESMPFSIFEQSMMEAPLAKKYNEIKTYTAISQNDARITAKIDFTVFGFHAMVFDGSNTFYIDPYSNNNSEWYVVYYKKNFKKNYNQIMHCEVDDDLDEISLSPNAIKIKEDVLPELSFKTSGDSLRTYRLALACTEEYSAAVGGSTPSKATVLSAIVTSVNRVNGVFEREFSMHANLVANNDTLIYLPGSGDPYTNNSGSAMLGQNQTTINARIGSANYDFGHVFSTGGGGIASLACICATNKAQGVTGSSNPVGDPFDIDYVAHEMGHQFGGSHTFNSVTGSCSGNRSSNSAYEIGSATTIMGYAGICGTDNIQPHSDDYYHVRSLEQMTGSSVKACAAITMTGNTPPVLTSINKTYIIPYKTPFELTATATDANNDPLTYCWEQYNRGGSGSAWNAKTTVAPILRSFNPDTSGTRVFPKYSELIKNTESYLGEILPDTARILRFRCTVRDMHLGNGAFYTSVDTTKLDVRQTASLFRVTSQNTTGQSWTGYESKTITWNVAGTDIAPVAANNVNIYLSIDSGKTWPFILASNTSNDGSESIVVPNFASDWARVKVKGAGNVFFDLNDEWIQIKKVVSPSGIENYDESLISIYPNPSQGEFDIHLSQNKEIGKIEIVNSVGQTVYEDMIGSNKTHLNTNLSQGVYFVKIQVDNKHIVKKIIVN